MSASPSSSSTSGGKGKGNGKPVQRRTYLGTLVATPLLRVALEPDGQIPKSTSEICFIWCSQTHLGRNKQDEPKCRAFCFRNVLEHELVDRTHRDWKGYNYSYASDHPVNNRKPFVWRRSDKLPLPSQTSLVDHLRGPRPRPIHPIPPKALATSPISPTGSTAPPSQTEPRREVRVWREGRYLWTSKSRRDIMRHLSTEMRNPLDWQRNHYNWEAVWRADARSGRDPSLAPTNYPPIWRSMSDLDPRGHLLDPTATMIIALDDWSYLREEFARTMGPVYAAAADLFAKQVIVVGRMQGLWKEEGKARHMVYQAVPLWREGNVARHSRGLYSTLVEIVSGDWQRVQSRGRRS
ncbi:hypothetical protein PENSPDRAFT_648395 [Peniophora sp. CONT]|nr:hypothetical protein PENSPDRAFT_648395 [Peniophora sp. CONT]